MTASALNLRAAPGAQHAALRTLPKGTRVVRQGATDDGAWIYIGLPAQGWLSATYLAAAPALPPVTPMRPIANADREKLWGRIEFVRAPLAGNPENIRITNGWASENIVACVIPQLIGIPGAPKDGKVWLHRKAQKQLLALFAAWEAAKLLGRIKTWDGLYNPRLVRGSTTSLSNHAYGTAMDLCARWNGLGVTPPAVGQPGSVRELVPLAEQYGFFWGGNFDRHDGMHFEVARLL